MKFLIRITINSPDDERYVHDVLDDPRIQTALMVRHSGRKAENEHYHLVVDTCYSMATLRARLKKFWTAKLQISMKEYDPSYGDKPYIYLFHEKDRIHFQYWSKGIDEKTIDAWSDQAVPKTDQTDELEHLNHLKRKQRTPTFAEVLLERSLHDLKPEGLLRTKTNSLGKTVPIDKQDVLEYIVKNYSKDKKVFDKFIINRMYNLVAYHLFGHKHAQDVVADVILM